MYKDALPRVLEAFGIKYDKIYDFQKGYRNEIWPVKSTDGRMLSIIFYKREVGILAKIAHADVISEYLANLDMPTRQRAYPKILSINSESQSTSICMYNYLPGNTIPWEAYTMDHIKLLGATMSDMHAKLSGMKVIGFPDAYDEYLIIIKRLRAYLSDTYVLKAISLKLGLSFNIDKLDDYEALLGKYKLMPSKQVLHMDFVRGNILFDKAKPEYKQQLGDIAISGILDFEKTATGHPIMDISRTLAFLMVDCKYKTINKVIKYFLYSGYRKRGKNKDIGDDKDRNMMVEMFLVYDFYKFLRHNPYESLHLNQHYKRTADILARRGVIF